MVDQCSNCVYGRSVPVSAGVAVGALGCSFNAPAPEQPYRSASPGVAASTQTVNYPWPLVQPDYWCGNFASSIPVAPTGIVVSVTSVVVAVTSGVTVALTASNFSATRIVPLVVGTTTYYMAAATTTW
jgi:hypothetical protein